MQTIETTTVPVQAPQETREAKPSPAVKVNRIGVEEEIPQTESWLENPWRATMGFELAAFVRQHPTAEGVPEVSELSRLGNKLCEWLSSYGPTGGLQLQLRANPARQTLRVVLLAQFDGATEDDTVRQAGTNARELQQILGACAETRFEPVTTVTRLDEIMGDIETGYGRLAVPVVGTVAMAGYPDLPVCERWRPHGADAMGDMIQLMLSHAGPVSTVVSLTAVADRRPLFQMRALP